MLRMMQKKDLNVHPIQVKETFIRLGLKLEKLLLPGDDEDKDKIGFEEMMLKVRQKNPWFTREHVCLAFSAWAEALKEDQLNQWLQPYLTKLSQPRTSKTIAVINAGNIPLVGFHDLLSVLISGHIYLGKNSSDDPYLLPFIAELLMKTDPWLKKRISFSERLSGFDAVIATGSNNSARYFDFYFGKYPHIIRMNRNGVAVLTGDEDARDLKNLGTDIFRYFGLGCRNVSRLFVPRNYNFKNFFEAIEPFNGIAQHHKYMNNYDYNKAIYLLKRIDFLDNGFLILKEDAAIASPIAVVYYDFYDDLKSLEEKLSSEKEKIQCVIGTNFIPFGNAQHPGLADYADGVDTMEFLLNIEN